VLSPAPPKQEEPKSCEHEEPSTNAGFEGIDFSGIDDLIHDSDKKEEEPPIRQSQPEPYQEDIFNEEAKKSEGYSGIGLDDDSDGDTPIGEAPT